MTAEEVPSLVDEVPILALVASQAHGETRFEGVGELRVKESDRLAAITDGLTALGATAEVDGDTLVVRGPAPLRGATLDSLGRPPAGDDVGGGRTCWPDRRFGSDGSRRST